jgi:hypothetical protein
VLFSRAARPLTETLSVSGGVVWGMETTSENLKASVYKVNSNKWTFEDVKVKKWVENQLNGTVLNACAGETKLHHNGPIHRNDVNPDRPADTHHDVRKLPDVLPKGLLILLCMTLRGLYTR